MSRFSPLVRCTTVLLFGLVPAILLGCGGTKTAKIDVFPEYAVNDPATATQTQSDVAITVAPLSKARMYELPELFAFQKDGIAKEIAGGINFGVHHEKDFEGKYWCYTFGVGEDQIAVFQVEIRNGTGHILRMADARIYFEVDGQEPYPATTRFGEAALVPGTTEIAPVVPTSYKNQDQTLVHWITHFEMEAERKRPKQTLFDSQQRIPIGLASQVIQQNQPAYKLVASPEAEILPGRSLKGILVFPVVVTAPQASVVFYDIHTKADAAGNVTEKQTFRIPLQLRRVQMQWDGKQEKRWKRVGAAS